MKSKSEAHNGVHYKALPTSPARRRPQNRQTHSSLLAFGAGCLLTAILAVIVAFIVYFTMPYSGGKSAVEVEAEDWNYCGRSSAIAKARGCVMEPLFYGWMPPQCVYSELTKKHPVFDDRKFYRDKNMTQELRPDELWAGEHVMIYTKRYHSEHCLFQWRKLQYAMDKRMEFLDNKTISMHHTSHCADQLSELCEGPLDVSEIELGFYRCRKSIW